MSLSMTTHFLKKTNLVETYRNIEEYNIMSSNQNRKINLNNLEKYIEIYKNIQKYVTKSIEKNTYGNLKLSSKEIINIITNIIFVFTIANEIISNDINNDINNDIFNKIIRPKEIKTQEDQENPIIKREEIKKINDNLSEFLLNLNFKNYNLEFNLHSITEYLQDIFLDSVEKLKNPNYDSICIQKILFRLCHIEKKLPYVKSKFSYIQKNGGLSIRLLELIQNIKENKFFNSKEIIERKKKTINIYDIDIGIHLFSNNNREIEYKIQKSKKIGLSKIIIITSVTLVSILTPTLLLIYKIE